MVVDLQRAGRSSVDFKSTQLPLLAVIVREVDFTSLRTDLVQRLQDSPDFFTNQPLLIDLQHLPADAPALDFAALVQLLRQHHTQPVAVRSTNPVQQQAAQAQGLLVTDDGGHYRPLVREVEVEVVREVEVEVIHQLPPARTLVIDKPLRSGQQIYAKGCDVVVLAMVSYGAEVIADGSVHVYAPLRGRAVAGVSGNTQARIFSTCMQPQLLSIAGVYRTFDDDLPEQLAGKPAQARLDGQVDSEKLLLEPLL